MGASQKRKKEKQKDFQKPKLKVGKAKAKPDNFTDTSFKSKSIVLNQQSLKLNAPTANAQFTHHLSLLSSKSDAQRRDSIAHLTTSITARPVDSPLPQPVSMILPAVLPLILDANSGVRTQLLKLLRSLPESDVQDHVIQLLPYIRAGMTHLAADIRLSAIEILSWLLHVAGAEVVSSAGGWVKTLNCFLSLLGWHTEASSKWTSISSASASATTKTSTNRSTFGKAGAAGRPQVKVAAAGGPFPIVQVQAQMIPRTAAPYLYLNLFGQPRDEEGEMYETREDRYRVFESRFLAAVEKGVEGARQEGGEVGRASAGVRRALAEGRT
ncbi:hypothetical protein AOCH_003285 [Aspergillus ochraceoroseus]|uniref:Pre-rRNA-processing protein n=1 Tax=Aspergillus ochraceoroseus TaxID=138278 RepID=A0A0F8VPJ4_9EURO|nr:hypothetical protein AOCH_003285 [Aspergillus ochraceoroseus]